MHPRLPLVAAALAAAATAPRLAAGVTVTYSGYVVDDLCFDKCTASPDCDKCALDKTNVLTAPQTHTVHCIRDVQVCIDSGYGLLAQVGTASDPDYRYKYKFDENGNDQVLTIIKATSLDEGLAVTATGEDNGDGYLRNITSMSQCNGGPSVCDTQCTGCASLPGPTTDALQTNTKPRNVEAHGAMLIIAWGFLAPTGALIKRHANTIPSLGLTRKVMGFPLAFVLHVCLMSTAAALTIAAVSIAFNNFNQRTILGHGIIGTIILALAILQPIEGFFFRPDHDSPRRIYFNIVHHYTGGFAVVGLGMANIILGCINYRTLWDNCKAPVFIGFAAAGVAIAVVAALVLEIIARVRKSKESGSSGAANPNPYKGKNTAL